MADPKPKKLVSCLGKTDHNVQKAYYPLVLLMRYELVNRHLQRYQPRKKCSNIVFVIYLELFKLKYYAVFGKQPGGIFWLNIAPHLKSSLLHFFPFIILQFYNLFRHQTDGGLNPSTLEEEEFKNIFFGMFSQMAFDYKHRL